METDKGQYLKISWEPQLRHRQSW